MFILIIVSNCTTRECQRVYTILLQIINSRKKVFLGFIESNINIFSRTSMNHVLKYKIVPENRFITEKTGYGYVSG
jgi:hypothetical protein